MRQPGDRVRIAAWLRELPTAAVLKAEKALRDSWREKANVRAQVVATALADAMEEDSGLDDL